MQFRIVDGCPCPASVAPYIYMVLREAGQTASSIYRGDDAATLLHRYGKHTQAEIHRLMPAISNPAGFSQHELRSDGAGNLRVPRGGRLEEWQVGVDSGGDGDAAKAAIEHAARRLGWYARHPYPRGVEGHHWCFGRQPKPTSLKQRAKIIRLRATLPRR